MTEQLDTDMLEGHQKICDGRYFTWRAFNAVAWALAILVLGMIGSSTGYAVATSTALAKVEQRLETARQELDAMKATYAAIDSKLDVLVRRGEGGAK